ncbi:LAFE_0G18316g1_1 [Lachancea fermentati]|uniref:LAFE_0G18316g1_1 n=1 Tax=Lachancea fermentati TaxID=4955 RepID=A0A1G4MJ31_LACFM|nr:LAFE_0G18316g1_1 [Lachancea fermentati]
MALFARNIKVLTRFQARSAASITYKTFLQQQQQVFSKKYSTESLEERYQEKLLEKAKSEGFDSIEKLKEHQKEEIEQRKKQLNRIDPLKELEEYEQRMKMSQNNIKAAEARGAIDPNQPKTPFKTLDSFLKVDKIKDLSKQEIEFLWRARWASKENVMNAVVPREVFEKMLKNIKEAPTFVLPLPRIVETGSTEKDNNEQGMELHYVQWQFAGPCTIHCIITSLAEYKLHQEFAKPHTTFQFHQDLADEKRIVLMNGQVETDSNVSLQDAQLLLLNIQRFYGAMGEQTSTAKQRVKLLHDFSKGSQDFSVELLISLAQSMEN